MTQTNRLQESLQPHSKIYLDYAASAPMRPLASEMFAHYAQEYFQGSNPYSVHEFGKQERQLLERARKQIAAALGVHPQEIYFCSGGTEGDNLCLQGLARGARAHDPRRTKVLISSIEHSAIAHQKSYLSAEGFDVQEIPVDGEGYVLVEALKAMLDDTVALVSIMAVNNETGTIQPTDECSRLAHDSGAAFHSDMVQAYMRTPVDLSSIDSVTIAGHKIGAPHGTGAFYLKRGVPYEKVMHGGIQESGIRPGTPNAIGAAILGELSQQLSKTMKEREEATKRKALLLVDYIRSHTSHIRTTLTDFEGEPHVFEIVSLVVPGVNKQMMVLALDEQGYEISSGSPCDNQQDQPNHVLVAMKRPADEAHSCIRVSFDERVPDADILAFAEVLTATAETLLKQGHL